MPSGLRKTTGNHFEMYYEEPWGGVASDKSPVDIDPNQLVAADGVVIRNGLLCYANIASQNSKWDLELIPPTTPPSDPPIVQTLTGISCAFSDFLGKVGLSSPYGYFGTGTFTVPDSSIVTVGQTFIYTYTPTDYPGPLYLLQVVTAIPNGTTFISGLVTPPSSVLPYGLVLIAVESGGIAPPVTGVLTYFTQNISIPTTPTNSTFTVTSATPSAVVGAYYTVLSFAVSALPANFYFGMPFTYTSGTEAGLNGTYVALATPNSTTIVVSCNIPTIYTADTGGTAAYFNTAIPFPITPAGYWINAVACLIFNCANYLCAVDQYGNAYIATLQTDGTIKFQFDLSAADGPTLTHGFPVAVKVVAGVAYISVYSTSTLYAYIPTVSYTVATTFTAGQFVDIFDEYMLQLNCNSTVDGVQPTLVSWSTPDAFTEWDPSVDRTAGYQLLTSVEDYISGFIAVDNVGYIFKRTGITQITSTGVAIQPWVFTTYWNSVIGQGLIFPGTLKQYGQFVFLATDSDIYIFSSGNFIAIAGHARAAIFDSFNVNPASSALSNNLIAGGINIYPFNDSIPEMEYVFIAATTKSGYIIFWFYNAVAKAWTSVTRAISDLLAEYVDNAANIVVNSIQTASVFLNPTNSLKQVTISNLPVMLVYINFSYTINSVMYNKTFIYYNVVNTPTADTSTIVAPPGNLNLVFRSEEIKLGFTRKCTIRRAVIKAYGTGLLTLTITDISGVVTPLGSIALDDTMNQRTYYSPYGIATVEAPQLTITSADFCGAIIKVMLAGTYADGEID